LTIGNILSYLIKVFVINAWIWCWLALTFLIFRTTRHLPNRRTLRLVLPLFLWVIGLRPVTLAIGSLVFGSYSPPTPEMVTMSGVRDVVVLSGGSFDGGIALLPSQDLGDASLARTVGGLEVCAVIGDSARLIITGRSSHNAALSMHELARQLRPGLDIYVDSTARRTIEHPAGVKPFLREDTFLLVTSHGHMRRSLRTFRSAGLNPIPCPVEIPDRHVERPVEYFIPRIDNLETLERVAYELMGMILYSFSGVK
jgi:uncharacterized SAM-binding protein YcdF (DUF218 family)